MRIALDGMGGDHAPEEIVKGAVEACQEYKDLQVVLVGEPERLGKELGYYGNPQRISIHPATELIGMDEHPASAIRKKKDASIVVATRLVKEGAADAVVSAGNTGAQMAAALFGLGRIKGIDRPAICTVMPTLQGVCLLLDVGANADSKPKNLQQFAQMGSIYAEKILHIPNPKVGLLNIGEEETKGNELCIAAYPLLTKTPIHFIGNVEGRDILQGHVDVIVCDGFVGNVVLKFGEGMAHTLMGMIKEAFGSSILARIGAAMAIPALKDMKKRLDYSEYGGAPLLGVDGVSIISHGSSKARAVKNAIRVATECVNSRFIDAIRENIRLGDGNEHDE